MKDKKIKRIYILLIVLGIISLLSGITYAVLTVIIEGIQDNVLRAGTLQLRLDEANAISVDDALPLTDEQGKTTDPMNFTVTNEGSFELGYTIYIAENPLQDNETRIPSANIRYEIVKDGSSANINNLTGTESVALIDTIAAGVTKTFELRIWIDYDTTTLEATDVFRGRLKIVATQGLPSLAAGEPQLIGDMIPVTWSGAEWVKANPLTWYNYDEQEWANAVTVTETNRETYVNASPGTAIPMNDINGMFVWIPRYSYTIGNSYGYQVPGANTPSQATPGAIDIRFVSIMMTELGNAVYTGDTPENWYTHPAFCWGTSCDDPTTRQDPNNKELPGIWVAKFEASTTGTVTSDTIQQPIVKPGVISWRNVTLGNMFNSTQQFMNGNNGKTIYGLESDTYDAHMMKNTEWGVVAYLSQSIFGKYGNTDYTGVNKEVAINNCNTHITGIGGDTVSAAETSSSCTTNTYETEKGMSASTTGNIYGVYDMSGGALEYVMGNGTTSYTSHNKYNPVSSGLADPGLHYYNKHINTGGSLYEHILGDATRETTGFYGDEKNSFVNEQFPWFRRGGGYNQTTIAGLFNTDRYNGAAYVANSFRITITP